MTTLTQEPETQADTLGETPLLLDGQALIEGNVCVLIQAEDPSGNFYADADTGEFVAFAVKPTFKVDDDDSFNWVMGRMLDCEARIGAIETAAEVLKAKAILANAESMRKGEYQRLAWLEFKFIPDMGEYAKKQLEGKTGKTYKTFLGSVSLKTKKAALKVVDKVKALEWAKAYWPDAVKTEESFLISLVPDNVRDEMIPAFNGDDHEPLAPYGESVRSAFVFEPETETVTIKTGVTTKAKA